MSNPFDSMVAKAQWDKVMGKLDRANTQTKLEIAEACSKSSDDESMNILVRLLQDTDESVQLQAVKSLGASGRNSAKTHLTWMAGRLPDSKVELKAAIKEASMEISKRNRN